MVSTEGTDEVVVVQSSQDVVSVEVTTAGSLEVADQSSQVVVVSTDGSDAVEDQSAQVSVDDSPVG